MAAGFIAAGLLSVIVFPVTGLTLLRPGASPAGTGEAGARVTPGLPSPSGPLVGAEDRAVCRSAFAGAGASINPLATAQAAR